MPATPTVIQGDVIVQGNVSARSISNPAGGMHNAGIFNGVPGDYIDPNKMGHQRNVHFSQDSATTAVAETKSIAVVNGTSGVLQKFSAGSVAICIGAGTITIDLKRNGTSLLSAPLVLNSSNTARVPVEATIATPSLAQNDLLEVVMTAAAGGGTIGTGAFARLVFTEDPA